MQTPSAPAPGQDGPLLWLRGLREQVAADGRGQIVFITGLPGSGRTSLLRSFTTASSVGRTTVLGGRFDGTGYIADGDVAPAPRVAAVVKRILSTAGSAATLAEVALPFAGLIRQGLAKSSAALQLAEESFQGDSPPDLSRMMPRVLSVLCEEHGMVTCVIDDADRAPDSWWLDLVILFANHLARDLPLLLVLSLEGSSAPGSAAADESYACGVARELTTEGRAHWNGMPRVTAAELQRWTGPAAPDVVRALVEVTMGRAGWISLLWEDWQRRETVIGTDSDSRWRFADARPAAPGLVMDIVGARLKRLLRSEDNAAVHRAMRLLACAALEGRQFTAEALADALGRERDAVNDEIDSVLILDETHPDGFLVNDGSVAVIDEQGERTLRLYRFEAHLDWLTLRHYGLAEREARGLNLRLARSLQANYGREAHRVAHKLERLFKAAGKNDSSRSYERMGLIGVGRDVILWRADTILASPDPVARAARKRASVILLAAAKRLMKTGPFPRGLMFAQAAQNVAVSDTDLASACYIAGACLRHIGDYSAAIGSFDSAIDIYRHRGERGNVATALHARAHVACQRGELDRAYAEYNGVLEMQVALRARSGIAGARASLANIASMRGELVSARQYATAALNMQIEIGDRHGEAYSRSLLAGVAFKECNLSDASAAYLAVLDIERELHDQHGEAKTRCALAAIEGKRRNYAKARAELHAVLEIQRAVDDRYCEAGTLHALADVDMLDERYREARSGYLAVLSMRQTIRDRHGEATTLFKLAEVDVALNDFESAEHGYVAALAIQGELRDGRGEKRTLDGLAKVALRREADANDR